MAHFRGTLDGCRGQASRLGSKRSGLRARAATWEGAGVAHAMHDEIAECDRIAFALETHQGRGVHRHLLTVRADGTDATPLAMCKQLLAGLPAGQVRAILDELGASFNV